MRDEINEVRRGAKRVWSRGTEAWISAHESVNGVLIRLFCLLHPGDALRRRRTGRYLQINLQWVGAGLAAAGAPAAEKPDMKAGSHGQLMSDLLVLPQKQLPGDLFLINNH